MMIKIDDPERERPARIRRSVRKSSIKGWHSDDQIAETPCDCRLRSHEPSLKLTGDMQWKELTINVPTLYSQRRQKPIKELTI